MITPLRRERDNMNIKVQLRRAIGAMGTQKDTLVSVNSIVCSVFAKRTIEPLVDGRSQSV